MHFPFEMPLKSLNEALKNDKGKDINHSHTFVNLFQRKTSFPLSLLASIPKIVPNILLFEP